MPPFTEPQAQRLSHPLTIPRIAAEPPSSRLSEAAGRLSAALGLPLTPLAGVEAEHPAYLREHSRALNELIEGRPSPCGAASVLAAQLAAAGWEGRALSHPPAFPGL